MNKRGITFYEVLLFAAYAFFILLGLAWFFMSFSGGFNPTAFFIVVVFAVQAYYRHRLTNLILGVLALFFSIFMLMDVISTYNLMDKHAVYNGFVKGFILMSLVSVVMSVILVFGYLKMSFKE